MFINTANVSAFLHSGNIGVYPEFKLKKNIFKERELNILKYNSTLHITCIFLSQIYTKN